MKKKEEKYKQQAIMVFNYLVKNNRSNHSAKIKCHKESKTLTTNNNL